jgi:HAD superfamily hydrolase (TIGR01450 family)
VSARPLPLDGTDVLLLDLDGVVYRGASAVPYAVDVLRAIEGRGIQLGYITNNASRRAAVVAEQLRGFGLPCADDQVVTSPQAAVRLLAERLAPDARILVIGGDGLESVVRDAGFTVVASADEHPQAVVQGFSPDLGWRDLAEAAFALADVDVLWVATNTDWTLPVDRGIAPGNGTLVSAVHAAVGRLPAVAGKPETPLFETAVDRFRSRSPFFVGDRLDTDIAGAVAAGMPSALVLTGIDGPKELLAAPEKARPEFVLEDLRGLVTPYPEVRRKRDGYQVGGALVRVRDGEVEILRAGERVDVVRAACAAVWASGTSAYALRIPDVLLRRYGEAR